MNNQAPHSVYVPLEASKAMRLFTAAGLSLSQKLAHVTSGAAIVAANTSESAILLGQRCCVENFLILQIQIGADAMSELRGLRLTKEQGDFCTIYPDGVQYIIDTAPYVGMSVTLEAHSPNG